MALPKYEKRKWTFFSGFGGTHAVPPGGGVPGATGEARTDVRGTAFSIVNWQILSGGTLAPHVSYYFQVVGEIIGQDLDKGISKNSPKSWRMY